MILARKRAILAKIETTEGTDPVPTGEANAILCGAITVTPMAGGTVDRQFAYPSFGATPQVHINQHVTVQFDVELSGSGTAGTAPAWGVLLRMCGMAETIVEDASVAYLPVSGGQESGGIYANEGGILHKLVGARGTFQIVCAKNDIPKLRFTFTGRWTVPSSAALPASTFAEAQINNPLVMNKANTPTLALHGQALVATALTIDLGNTVIHRDIPNAAYVAITDRQSSGSITFEQLPLATKDFFAAAYSHALGALALVHGTHAGNIVSIGAPKVQLLEPSYQEEDGIKHLQARLRLNRDTGDDELSITLT